MPFTIDELLSADRVSLDVDAGSKKHALELLSQRLVAGANDASANEIFDALIERERLGCTAAEGGLALPHAKLEDVREIRGALMTLAAPVDFDSGDDDDVDVLIGFVLPMDTDDERLESVRRLMQKLINPAVVELLRNATDADAAIRALTDADAATGIHVRSAGETG